MNIANGKHTLSMNHTIISLFDSTNDEKFELPCR